jgi:hypothetical protein
MEVAMSTSRGFLTGLAVVAGVFIGVVNCHAQPLGPVESLNGPNGLPVAHCSRPADQEALRVKQLADFVDKSRRIAVQNPLLLADVAYYEAELAASRRCLQSLAAR